jgi:hypothetical protein
VSRELARDRARAIDFCTESAPGKLEARLALAALANRFCRMRLVTDRSLTVHPNIAFRNPTPPQLPSTTGRS